MGGSGGRSFSDRELKKLEDIAKSELKKSKKSNNVFISFKHSDKDEVNLFRGQMKNKNNDLNFKDFSIKEPYNSDKEDYIKRKIREKIKQTSITLVYLTPNSANSDWINWEINESLDKGNYVIPFYKKNKKPSKIPNALEKNNIEPIEWDHKNILSKINGLER